MIGLISTLTTVATVANILWSWSKEGDLILTEDVEFFLELKVPRTLTSSCGYITLNTNGVLRYKKGYIYDGCTGVPDGQLFRCDASQVEFVPIRGLKTEMIPLLWEAPLIHDGLYQLLVEYWYELRNEMFNRKDADKQLLNFMKSNGDAVRGYIYYGGVRVLGGVHLRKARKALEDLKET